MEIRSHLSQRALLGSDCPCATRVFKEATGKLGSAGTQRPHPCISASFRLAGSFSPFGTHLGSLFSSFRKPSWLFPQPYRLCRLPFYLCHTQSPFSLHRLAKWLDCLSMIPKDHGCLKSRNRVYFISNYILNLRTVSGTHSWLNNYCERKRKKETR